MNVKNVRPKAMWSPQHGAQQKNKNINIGIGANLCTHQEIQCSFMQQLFLHILIWPVDTGYPWSEFDDNLEGFGWKTLTQYIW